MTEAFQRLVDAVGQCQALNQASLFILNEIVIDLAKSHPSPNKYLADMFERISARADQDSIESEAHPVSAEFRATISTFFSVAGKAL